MPAVTDAQNLVKLSTQDCRRVTGGLLSWEKDAIKAVDVILAHKMIGIPPTRALSLPTARAVKLNNLSMEPQFKDDLKSALNSF